MAAGVQTETWHGPSRRRTPRFLMQAPVDLTVLRSGVPDTLPGRSVNVCERGVAAIVAGELMAGEAVGVELQLPPQAEPLRARAVVRYQDRLRCGLEFAGLSAEQRAAIRDWAKEAKASADDPSIAAPLHRAETDHKGNELEAEKSAKSQIHSIAPIKARKRRRGLRWTLAVLILLSAAGVWWWHWNHAWDQLELSSKGPQANSADSPAAQVPAEVMEKLLVHRVQPLYPAEARKEKLEGTIALNIVIGRDGSVQSMRPLNGPDVLARAAMDALRWWKFEPYRINGRPAAVETTVAVEFKR